MRVVFAGGGIAGLTGALACLRAGLQPLVLERAPVLGEVGAGIQLSPNAMQVLLALGLEPALRAVAVEPEALELRLGDTGARVFAIPAGKTMRDRYGAPYLHIHREDLIAVLARALDERAPGALQTDREVTALRGDPAGVDVTVSSGQVLAADVVIGADGIRSTVKAHLGARDAPHFTGQVAWRATVPVAGLPEEMVAPRARVWVGPGRHLVTYLVRGGRLVNLVAVQEEDSWELESWHEPGDPDALRAAFAGFCAPVRKVLDRVDTCLRWALHDRSPLKTWVRGRIGLMGDACHPMLPFQAQGAAMAIEDAWVLAASLRGLGPMEGLGAYARRRQPRTARVQASARANAGVFHRRTPLTQVATYGPMVLADRFVPWVVHTRQDWIYGHNVVAGAQ